MKKFIRKIKDLGETLGTLMILSIPVIIFIVVIIYGFWDEYNKFMFFKNH